MLKNETLGKTHNRSCPDCKEKLENKVLRSAGGYYIGTFCLCGPYSRESGYYRSPEEAQSDLELGRYGR